MTLTARESREDITQFTNGTSITSISAANLLSFFQSCPGQVRGVKLVEKNGSLNSGCNEAFATEELESIPGHMSR